MKKVKIACMFVIFIMSVTFFYGMAHAEEFRIAIMQDKKGAAQKFKPLAAYLEKSGINISFVGTPNYTSAAKMFAAGKADAMFSGSGVAGSMIIKDVSYPVVRPLSKAGTSTYWAVVLAPKGAEEYTGSNEYFKGKRVIFCSLASSGEFFFRSIKGQETASRMMKAASHGAAIDALSKGVADVAIVKNRVWDKVKSKYPNIALVGKDNGENPNGTLIVSKMAEHSTADKVRGTLLALRDDTSPEADDVRAKLNIQGYIQTTGKDFSHTLALLKQAGVNKAFNFSF